MHDGAERQRHTAADPLTDERLLRCGQQFSGDVVEEYWSVTGSAYVATVVVQDAAHDALTGHERLQ